MVSKHAVYYLLDLVLALSYVKERAHDAAEPPFLPIQVKGPGYTFDALSRVNNTIQPLSVGYKELEKSAKSIKEWISHLDKKYELSTSLLSNKNILNQNDAKKLQIDVDNCIQAIIDLYSGSDTKYIDEHVFYQIPKNIKGIDEITRKDLRDGIDAIANELPTPAVMIMCRSVERVLQKYYTRITTKEVGKKPMGVMVTELSDPKYKVQKSLLVYLNYINEERINADHPYKRYSQKESEEVLHHIVKAIEIITSKLENTQD